MVEPFTQFCPFLKPINIMDKTSCPYPGDEVMVSDDEVRDGVEEARRRLQGHGGADH
jgi:hypothetical protein